MTATTRDDALPGGGGALLAALVEVAQRDQAHRHPASAATSRMLTASSP
jgi:hypothetical protein